MIMLANSFVWCSLHPSNCSWCERALSSLRIKRSLIALPCGRTILNPILFDSGTAIPDEIQIHMAPGIYLGPNHYTISSILGLFSNKLRIILYLPFTPNQNMVRWIWTQQKTRLPLYYGPNAYVSLPTVYGLFVVNEIQTIGFRTYKFK